MSGGTKTIGQLTPATIIAPDAVIEVETDGASKSVQFAELRTNVLAGHVAYDIDPSIPASIDQIKQDVAEILDSVGSGEAAAQSAALAEAARQAAVVARGNTEQVATVALQATNDATLAEAAASAARDAAKTNADASAISATGAAGSASTASGQASIATQRATDADTYATLASASADTATTKASQAGIFRDQAATSETNAAGSASAAATSQTLSANAKTAAEAARDNATTEAQAAASSASSAAASQTAAGQSASAAHVSELSAGTSAGQASTSATSAATSATGAAGSANSAGTSATVSATARDAAKAASLATIPDNFNDPSGWVNWANWGGSVSFANGLASFTNGGSTYSLARMPIAAGRTYRLTARHRTVNQGGGVTYLGVNVYNSAGNASSATQWEIAAEASAALGTWQVTTVDFTGDQVLAADPSCATVSPALLLGYPNVSDAQATLLQLIDVTSEKAAAGSATAAATSASTATASQTAAGLSATSASGSAVTATTQAGAASSSATAAAGSAATANSAASAAAASQTIAASYVAPKALTANGDFSKGTASWATTTNAVAGGPTAGYGTYLNVAQGMRGIVVSPIVRIDPSRRYRLHIKYVQHTSAAMSYAGLGCYDDNHNALGNIYMPSVFGQSKPAGVFYDFTNDYQGINPAWTGLIYTGGTQFPVGTTQVELVALLNYGDGTTNNALASEFLQEFWIEDVTESYNAASSASVASSQAASATSSAASAQTSATLSASVAGGTINSNSLFSDYPASAGAALAAPPQWNIWNSGAFGVVRAYGNGNPQVDGPHVEGSPWAFIQQNAANNDAGLYQDTPGTGGYYVVSATVALNDGSYGGSGVLVYGIDANANVISSDTLRFDTDPDVAGQTAAQLGYSYSPRRFSKLMFLGAGTAVKTIRIYAMTNWSGFGGGQPYKQMSWMRCGYRAASSAEIKSGQIDGIAARVTTNEGVIATVQNRTEAYSVKEVTAGGAAAFISFRAKDDNGVLTSDVGIGGSAISLYNPVNGVFTRAMILTGGNAVFTGGLQAGAFIRLGSGDGWPVALKGKTFSVADGDVINFGANLGALPNVTFAANNLAPLNSGETYRLYPENLTATGFTARLRISVPGSPQNYDLTSATAPGSGPTLQIDKSTIGDSLDGNYRLKFSGTTTIAGQTETRGTQ